MTDQFVDPTAGQVNAQQQTLADWVAPYATNMLGKSAAVADMPYTAYMGPLTAGQSGLQTQAFQGLANLTVPTEHMGAIGAGGSFTSGTTAQDFMSPYLTAALEPQLAEAQRQADIQRVQNQSRLTQAGAYGGGRQAIMDSEAQRNLLRNMADITGKGYQQAYTQGMGQFNTEADRQMRAQEATNLFGLRALDAQQTGGATQRGIESEGIAADIGQFREERDYPYKQLAFQQSMLQGLPTSSVQYDREEQSGTSKTLGTLGGLLELFNAWNEAK